MAGCYSQREYWFALSGAGDGNATTPFVNRTGSGEFSPAPGGKCFPGLGP
jgi:hypothetical protein